MIHFQRPTDGWDEALHRLPSGSLFKCVDQGQEFALVKRVANERGININTCLRHWYDPGQVFGGTYEQNKDKARAFFSTFIDGTFIDQIAQHCDYIEEWNEYLASSQNSTEVQERVTWARAAADVWLNEYRTIPQLAHIRLVLCNAPIGNWIHRDFAVVAREYDCAIGYHPYTGWGFDGPPKIRWGEDDHLDDGVLDTLDWLYLSGLWDSMELDWGIDVDWVFTEAGPFEAALDGWRSSNCLGGDRDLYVAAMRDWIRDIQQTPAYAEGRIVGFATYTTGRAGDTWKHFWTELPELNSLADMFAQEWHPGTPAPPPDPPPDDWELDHKVTVNLAPQNVSDAEYDEMRERTKENKETILQSADDAAWLVSSGKPGSKVKVWAGHRWPDDIYQWLRDRGVDIIESIEFLAVLIPFFIWPVGVSQHTISCGTGCEFDAPRAYYGNHEGIDLEADYGDPIYAAASGTVVWASDRRRSDGALSAYDNHVVINHRNGYITWYAHLESMAVQVGDIVIQGDTIGAAGGAGRYSTGAHLHFTIQHVGYGLSGYVVPDVVDPAPYLGL